MAVNTPVHLSLAFGFQTSIGNLPRGESSGPASGNQGVTRAPVEKAGLPPDKLRELCSEFEAIFLRQLLRRAKPSGEGVLNEGLAGDVFYDLYFGHLARQAAEAGGFGLTEVVYEQLRFMRD